MSSEKRVAASNAMSTPDSGFISIRRIVKYKTVFGKTFSKYFQRVLYCKTCNVRCKTYALYTIYIASTAITFMKLMHTKSCGNKHFALMVTGSIFKREMWFYSFYSIAKKGVKVLGLKDTRIGILLQPWLAGNDIIMGILNDSLRFQHFKWFLSLNTR